MIPLRSLSLALLCAVGACSQATVGPQPAASAPMEGVEAAAAPDYAAYAGQLYPAVAADAVMARYSLEALAIPAAEKARFEHAMSNALPGVLAGGGGAQALVFSGCAPSGCLEGLSVVAIDVRSGEVFVGVSDQAGADKLVPNDRLEALLRLTSPSQNWDDPVRPGRGAPSAAAP